MTIGICKLGNGQFNKNSNGLHRQKKVRDYNLE